MRQQKLSLSRYKHVMNQALFNDDDIYFSLATDACVGLLGVEREEYLENIYQQ